jgi:hypothetical protein
MTNKKEFENNGNNEVLDVENGCYVSYNANPGMGISMWASDDGEETAIVIRVNGERVFKILNGDFREKCLEIVNNGGGEKELLELYNKNSHRKSSWSNK